MAFVELVRESDGVPNYEAAYAHRPEIYRVWQQLNGAIKESMDLRRYELATLAAARRLRSSYCMLAHGGVLARDFLSSDQVREAALDHHSAGLEAVDVASATPSPSQVAEGRELLAAFRGRLSDEERRLADLRANGREWADIAGEVGGTAEARRKQLTRAVARVSRELGLDADEGDE